MATTEQTAVTEPGRGARRRARTRARLLEAAGSLFAEQGVEATTIAEITERADVGFGSFYNHFESKDEIADVVAAEIVTARGAALAALRPQLSDPAEMVSVAHRHFVGLARRDLVWGWLLIRLGAAYRIADGALAGYARDDITRGIEGGRFDVADPELALEATGGALVAVMRAVLDGDLRDDAAEIHAEGVLRLLGVEASDAAEVSRRPLPPAPPVA
jgi:AcrR family transcriptional regulator